MKNRRTLITAGVLVLFLLAGMLYAEGSQELGDLTTMTFISPRGTLEVMDDYFLWVAKEMGYFEELGIDVIMEPGPFDAFACTKFVDQNKADVGYPSPGILTASVDTGMDIIMVYEMMIEQVFDFAVRKDSDIKSIADVAGKTISVGDPGWQVIIDPILVEIGVDPSSVTYVGAGAQWGQTVALGKADIALCWKGLRAQWDAQGLNLRYFLGEDISKMPANGLAARKSDLDDPVKRDNLIKFLKAGSMGIHFARNNPRAAAQITYELFPSIQEQMEPQLALESMQQLHWGYTGGERLGEGYGWFEEDGWDTYSEIIYDLGQTQKKLKTSQIMTNELIAEANDFDHKKVEMDAKNFVLNSEWKNVKVIGDW
jgi:NitT/TauT family transport system substrate-binding protein